MLLCYARMRKPSRLGAIACLALLAACGKVGSPLPPSLELPQPVKDLRATRKAGEVTLTWTQPRETTDDEAARHLGETRICRSVGAASQTMRACEQSVGTVAPQAPARGKTAPTTITQTFSEELPTDLQASNPAQFAIYAVEADNRRGRAAGLSNEIAVPLAPTLPAPADLKAEVQADGVHVSATPSANAANQTAPALQFAYRLYRTPVPVPANFTPAPVAEVSFSGAPPANQLSLLDKSFDWEKTYSYKITPVTKVSGASGAAAPMEVEGEDSAPVEVFTRDTFPPAAPTGLQAVFSGDPRQNFIDLTWTPNTESDLAGYNVFRHQAGTEPGRLNKELAKTPAFRDGNVQPGQTYFYSISAVDLRGNESPRSPETSEAVPAQ